jgi:hypothetical protein
VRKILLCMLQVCSSCQRDCNGCATEQARKHFPDYELTLDDVDAFLRASHDSEYWYEKVWLNGFGEPLLWNHLEEGVKALSASNNVGGVYIRSNGIGTEKVTDAVLKNVAEISFSQYKKTKEQLTELRSKHGSRIKVLQPARFIKLKGWEAPVPCTCICSGPSIIGRWALPHCGPVFFSMDTARRLVRAGLVSQEQADGLDFNNWFEYVKVVGGAVEVKKGFLDNIITFKTQEKRALRNMDACRYCFGNRNFSEGGDVDLEFV